MSVDDTSLLFSSLTDMLVEQSSSSEESLVWCAFAVLGFWAVCKARSCFRPSLEASFPLTLRVSSVRSEWIWCLKLEEADDDADWESETLGGDGAQTRETESRTIDESVSIPEEKLPSIED